MRKKHIKPSENSYIKLTQDLMFKIYFTKNKKVLLSLLKAFLPLLPDQKIERIDILNSQNLPDTKEKKQIILDLKLRLNNKEKINVEMQASQKKDFLSRVLFYWAKLYTEDLTVSEPYKKVSPTYSLIFTTDFKVFKESTDFVTCFSLLSDQPPHFCFNNDLKIIFVELKKFNKKIEDLIDIRDQWCYTLKHSNEIKPNELQVLSNRNQDMKEAVVHLKRLSKDEELRMEEEARIKFLRDQMAEKDFAREEGLEEGLKKVAMKMLKEKFDTSTIQKITGLSIDDIQSLQKK